MLVHTGQFCGVAPVSAITNAGAYGVHLFFVASAFTLFSSLQQRSRSEKRPTLNFFLRRFFRIAPPFWLAILFYVWWKGTGPQYWAPHGIGWLDVLATACFAHGWSPTMINSVVPGGWSIAVEMNFYLLVPFVQAADEPATMRLVLRGVRRRTGDRQRSDASCFPADSVRR